MSFRLSKDLHHWRWGNLRHPSSRVLADGLLPSCPGSLPPAHYRVLLDRGGGTSLSRVPLLSEVSRLARSDRFEAAPVLGYPSATPGCHHPSVILYGPSSALPLPLSLPCLLRFSGTHTTPSEHLGPPPPSSHVLFPHSPPPLPPLLLVPSTHTTSRTVPAPSLRGGGVFLLGCPRGAGAQEQGRAGWWGGGVYAWRAGTVRQGLTRVVRKELLRGTFGS